MAIFQDIASSPISLLPHPADAVDLPISLLVLLHPHHVLEGALVVVLEAGLEQRFHPPAAPLLPTQRSHCLAVGGEIVHLSKVGWQGEAVQDLLHLAVLLFEWGVGVEAVVGVAAAVQVVVLDEFVGPEDVHGAGDEGEVGVHELVVVLEAVLEQVQLMDEEHLDVVLPSVGVLLQVNQVVHLLDEGLHSDALHPAYLLGVPQPFPGLVCDGLPVVGEEHVVGIFPHVVEQQQEDEVDLAVPVVEVVPAVHSFRVGQLHDAGDAVLGEELAAEVDEVVDEQYLLDVELVAGEDGGQPVEEGGTGRVHDKVVQTLHCAAVVHDHIEFHHYILEVGGQGVGHHQARLQHLQELLAMF